MEVVESQFDITLSSKKVSLKAEGLALLAAQGNALGN